MPRYYCDYCDTYLTHDSPSVRKQHNAGYKHKANVRSYYQQFEEQMTQTMLDQRIKEHLGQAAQFPPIGAAYSQHLASFPRPGVPILPRPMMPGVNPLPAGMRPPVLPLPIPGNPGYPSAPNMPSMVAPPGAPSLPNQVNGLPRPPTVGMPTGAPASTAPNTSIGAPSFAPPAMYQPNPAAPTSGGYDHFNANARAPESIH